MVLGDDEVVLDNNLGEVVEEFDDELDDELDDDYDKIEDDELLDVFFVTKIYLLLLLLLFPSLSTFVFLSDDYENT